MQLQGTRCDWPSTAGNAIQSSSLRQRKIPLVVSKEKQSTLTRLVHFEVGDEDEEDSQNALNRAFPLGHLFVDLEEDEAA